MLHQYILIQLLAIACMCNGMHAQERIKSPLEKAVDSFGSSQFMQWYNDSLLQKKISWLARIIVRLRSKKTSDDFADISTLAQKEIGVLKKNQLPLFQIDSDSFLKHFCGALTLSDGIYVNQDRLEEQKVSYGAIRSLLFHESVHVKYHDFAALSLCFLASTLSNFGVAHCIMSSIFDSSAAEIAASLAGAVCVAGYATKKLNKYMERRADIEGLSATKCYTCLQECAQRRNIIFTKQKNRLRNNGYLWDEDIMKIAHTLDNEFCDHHAIQ